MKRTFRSLSVILAAGIAVIYWIASRPQVLPPMDNSNVQVDSTGARSGGQKSSTEAIGQSAPDIIIQKRDVSMARISDFKGRTILLNFWATWCVPCIEELPSLVKLAEYGKTRGIQVIAVSVDEDWKLIDDLFKKLGLGEPGKSALHVFRDPGGEATKIYETSQFPETFLIDKEFVIKEKYVGAMDWMNPTTLKEIEEKSAK